MKADTKLWAARLILTLAALFTMVSPFVADWNASHIYNPLWPPHAKFHNAHTMSLAVLLGCAALFFIWRRRGDARGELLSAWLFAGLYWFSQVPAFLFPGVAWTDPNLLPAGASLSDFPIQLKGDIVIFALMAVVAWLIVSGTRRAHT